MNIDRWLTVGVSILVAGLIWLGASTASSAPEERAESRAKIKSARQLSPGASGPTVNLPPGVTVDPNTGLMIGFDLEVAEGTIGIPWETLRAYEYAPGLENMPAEIRKLDGKKVAMLGFLWPIYDYDDIHKFGLVGSHWSCCYGIPPGLGDVVIVTLAEGHEGLSQTFNPVRIQGTMRIGERMEGGFTVAIYEVTDARAVVLEY